MNLLILFRIFAAVVLAAASCKPRNIAADHAAAVEKGYKKIPVAEEMREKFPAVSFITHYGMKNTATQSWNTLIYVRGRHEVVLNIPVTGYDAEGAPNVDLAKAELSLVEMEKIETNATQQTTISFGDFQKKLSAAELEALVKSGWDFNTIGMPEKPPVEGYEKRLRYWEGLYPEQAPMEAKGEK